MNKAAPRAERPKARGQARRARSVQHEIEAQSRRCLHPVSNASHDLLRSRLRSPQMAHRFKPMKMHVAMFSSHVRWPIVPNTKTRPDKTNMVQQPSREVPMIFMRNIALFAN